MHGFIIKIGIIGLSIGFGVATAQKNATKKTMTMYYHLVNGIYSSNHPIIPVCVLGSTTACTISFETDPTGEFPTFTYQQLQDVEEIGGTAYESSANGYTYGFD